MGVNRLPPDVRGQELIVWSMDIISHNWFAMGCGEEKKRTETRNHDPEPPVRTTKYITSIMDEDSSDHMDEAGIPMLISGYNIIITIGSRIWGPDVYMASNTE